MADHSDSVRSGLRSAAAPDGLRNLLLDTADRLFYERGFQAVSMDQLRDASGVPLKRLYGYFPSKQHLVQAYLARRDEQYRDAIERYVTSRSTDPSGQLLLVFDALHAWVRHQGQYRGCAFHNAFGEIGGTSPASADLIRNHKHHIGRFLQRTARQGGYRRPRQLAAQLMLLAEGALVTSGIDGTTSAMRDAKDAAGVLLQAARESADAAGGQVSARPAARRAGSAAATGPAH